MITDILSDIGYSYVKSKGINIHINKNKLKERFKNLLSNSINELESFFRKNKSILIGINDIAKLTPTKSLLNFIDKYLFSLSDFNISFLVVSGIHYDIDKEHFLDEFGEWGENFPVFFHDYESSDFIEIGTTDRGTKVKVNSILKEYEGILYISSIEPHYFAGFTGNRMFVIPGIAHNETIKNNFSFALDEKSKNMNIYDNIVHLDMLEALQILEEKLEKKIFAIDIIGEQNYIYDAIAGEMDKTLFHSAKIAEAIYTQKVFIKADIIIANINKRVPDLYQAFKAFENCKNILAENGVIIINAPEVKNLGNKTFYKLLIEYYGRYKDLMSHITENYEIGAHKAYSIAKFILEKSGEIVIIGKLNDENSIRLPFLFFEDEETAIKYAVQKKETDFSKPDILIIDNATHIVPFI